MPLPSASPSRIQMSPNRIVAGGMAADLDVDAPAQGLVRATDAGGNSDRFLGVDLRAACTTTDHWTRGSDTIAVYEPADPRQLRATAMWRACPSDTPSAWEVVVSAQTALEQSDASVAVTADVKGDAVLWGVVAGAGGGIAWQATPPADPLETACVLVRRTDAAAPTSLLISGYPGDVHRLVVHQARGRVKAECWLFSSAAEKGVLFRGRVLTAIGPTADDTAWADAIRRWHAATPPVLTT
jgi:hypothetical protein